MPRDLIDSEVLDFSSEQTNGVPVVFDQAFDEQQQEQFLAQAREMILLREQKARLEKREGDLKKDIMNTLARAGEPYGPFGQHQIVRFPRAIRGIAGFVRQTKVTTGVDETRAEAIARQRGIYDRFFRMQPVLDDAAVMVALDEGLINDADLAEIFPKKTSHAFVVERAKK